MLNQSNVARKMTNKGVRKAAKKKAAASVKKQRLGYLNCIGLFAMVTESMP